MVVCGVEDAELGRVSSIRPECCFTVVGRDGDMPLRLTSIFNIVGPRVTLMCLSSEAHRYDCRDHGNKPADDCTKSAVVPTCSPLERSGSPPGLSRVV